MAGVLDCEIVDEGTFSLRHQGSNRRSKRARVVLDGEESDDWTLGKSGGEEDGDGEYENEEKDGIGAVKEVKEVQKHDNWVERLNVIVLIYFYFVVPASLSTLVKEIRSVSSSIIKNK
ncbi:516_t:CDS:2 [Paraglomus occultum]|uniref:516_t:CDS:1 n=1 Tax=Paraglomus occultum TaxID=144539 RepID=A0A9N9CGF0_9GLOM|nr:516_t:CDS:2 [Paraglomus occultum]